MTRVASFLRYTRRPAYLSITLLALTVVNDGAAHAQTGSAAPTVDVLVVYSQGLLTSWTPEAIAQEAAVQVADVNDLFARSGAQARVNLVGVEGLHTSSFSTLAQAVNSANGPGVHGLGTLRDQAAADVVVLVTRGVHGCYGSPGLPAHDLRQAESTYVSVSNGFCGFQEAIGRSLGIGSFPGASDAARPYAYGYFAFPAEAGASPYATFMSGGDGGTRLSDPTATVAGLTIGNPLTADARRAIDEAAPLVASYRGCSHATSGALTITAAPDGSEQSFAVTTQEGCATGVPDDLPAWLTVVSPATVYHTGPATVTLRAAANLEFAQRSARVTVGTRTVTITQQPKDLGACPTIAFFPATLAVDGDAESVDFLYRAPFGCKVIRRFDPPDAFPHFPTTYGDTGLRGYGDIWAPGRVWIKPNTLLEPRTEVIELAGVPLVVEQGPAPCRLGPYGGWGVSTDAAGTTQTFSIDVPPLCAWTIAEVPPWVSFAGPLIGTGAQSLTVSIPANDGAPRVATFQVVTADATRTVPVWQGGATCLPSFSGLTGETFPAGGGEIAVNIAYAVGEQHCAWTIDRLPDWLSASPLSGQGSSSVTFTVAPNDGPSRQAVFAFGQVLNSLVQSGPACSYSLSGLASAQPQGGQSVIVEVGTRDDCVWSPSYRTPSWLSAPFPVPSTGKGSFLVVVEPNTGYDRSATFGLEVVSADTMVVTQPGALGPSDTTGCATLSLSTTDLSADPQTLRAIVRQLTPCLWTVETDVSWLMPLPPYPQFGDAEFDVGVTANSSAIARSGSISIGGQTVTIAQVAGVGCSYAVPLSVRLPADGSSALLRITTDEGCTWTVPPATAPWLTIEGTGALRQGTGDIVMRGTTNTADLARRVEMTFRGSVFDVVQEGDPSCTLSLIASGLSLPMEGGRVVVDVTTPAYCTWAVIDVPPDATLAGPSAGAGPGTFPVDVPPNTRLFPVFDSINVNGRFVFVGRAAYVPYAPTRRYLAEGAVSGFFDTTISLFNPYFNVIDATLTFLRSGHPPFTTTVSLPSRGRADVRPATLFGGSDAEFATVIDTAAPIAIDRTMQWDATGYGSHTEAAIVSPSLTWYLAEGATGGGFNLFYLLQNPSPDAALVKVTYLRGSGLPPLEKVYSVPGESRQNIWVDVETFATGAGDIPLLADAEVSAAIEVQNDVPLIVERAMYLDRSGQLFGAGHNSAGVTAPATNWFLAEGATGAYFDMFVLLANPSDETAIVTVDYLRVAGPPLQKTYAVPPRSRFNIWVDQEEFAGLGTALADAAFSMALTSINGTPIVVERSMWWPGTSLTWHEAHNSPGATATGTRWAIAGGDHRPAEGRETYVLVANTSDVPASIEARFAFGNGFSGLETLTVPPKSRANLPVPVRTQAGSDRFSVVVESVDNGHGQVAQIVVEMAHYRDVGGARWQAGGNALATRLP